MEINTVIVAEKPSVAGSIAPLVGASQRKTGYLYNPDTGTAVTWALGHLVRLSDPKAYGWEKWSLADLPMMPEKFLLEVTDDPAVKARYAVVTSLMCEAQKIIVATDAGREGELIFRYIYGLSGCSTPFSRLWVSSLTDEAIREGLANLKPGNHYDNLFYAGKARSEADWLIGMNMTRAMTLKNAGGGVYSIGRVQTPTLGLIVNRFRDHEAFVPKPFYAPTIKLAVDGMEFSARYFKDYFDQDEAISVLSPLDGQVKCVSAVVKNTKERPPKLFDLSLLQRVCNDKFGYTAQQTHDLAQSLYERHKVLSYPRTDSNYLPEDFVPLLPDYFAYVGERVPNLSKFCLRLQNGPVSTLYIDGKKVSDHHALIPVINPQADYSLLNPDERNVFLTVVQRFVEAFMAPCERREQELLFVDKVEYFKHARKAVVFEGWREIAGRDKEDSDSEILPVQEGDLVTVVDKLAAKGMTTKPPLLTESSMIALMVNAGREIEDDKLKEEMKGVGLGTSVTRSAVIETLVKRGYIERNKKNLIPTPKGCELFDAVKDLDVAKVDMTARWEQKLADVEHGELSYGEFLEQIRKYTRDLTEVSSNLKVEFSHIDPDGKAGKCPFCGKPVRITKAGAGCTGWKKDEANSCRFFISRVICGAELSDEDLRRMLDGKPSKTHAMKSKAGKDFKAKIQLKNGRTDFIFADDTRKKGTAK